MYILKNAWRSISRAKVRNILIGVIVLVIATSSCVALSIREASGTAKEQYLEDMEVTAQISVDRQSMMQGYATIVGYSSDSAMTGFVAGTSTITDGQMFEENKQAYDCVISDELATYNELQVGDTIAVVNPNNEEESYTLTIVGLYNNQESGMSQTGMMGGFSTATDSANQIYMSYDALSLILEASEATAEATKQEDDETDVSALVNQLSGTYTFATVEDYETFEEEARALGLSDDYTISSGDLTSYEQSLQPLNNLSEYAMYFFIVILIIGGIILAVLNIFNIRERKYEIGVLAAIGMKKWKIAVQYTTELLLVTFIAVFIGTGIGAAGSVPITNALLEKQVENQSNSKEKQIENFGRGEMLNDRNGEEGNVPSDKPENGGGRGGMGEIFASMGNHVSNYVTEIDSATNLTVIVQLMGVGILLTLISSAFAITFVLRYDPLKIMANRD